MLARLDHHVGEKIVRIFGQLILGDEPDNLTERVGAHKPEQHPADYFECCMQTFQQNADLEAGVEYVRAFSPPAGLVLFGHVELPGHPRQRFYARTAYLSNPGIHPLAL